MDSNDNDLKFTEVIDSGPKWTVRLRSHLADDLGITHWFLDRQADHDYSSAQLADNDDDDEADHLFAASMLAAGVLTVFVVLTVVSAVVLALRLIAYFMDGM
jgi:hypothetical protein